MKNYLWNMFANIQNGQMANKAFILQRQTKICSSFLNILWNEGYILGYKIDSLDRKKFKVFLKYKNNKPVITALKTHYAGSVSTHKTLPRCWILM